VPALPFENDVLQQADARPGFQALRERGAPAVDLSGFGWLSDVATDRACDWPDCPARATVVGKNGKACVYLCEEHANDARGFRVLAIHSNELSPTARTHYEGIKQALAALSFETECKTFGKWLRKTRAD
jgi:hypothetical protein